MDNKVIYIPNDNLQNYTLFILQLVNNSYRSGPNSHLNRSGGGGGVINFFGWNSAVYGHTRIEIL